jgi:2-C-methyl-D-erythritol 4-phosphate cytidylyltransferase/2-C-methyl-D-erythritol 2,4-cyclodiphosphate synthase
MHVTAIIAAAGEGRRLGAVVPKQLLEIGGRSMLERSIAAFVSHPRVSDVIVVLPEALAAQPPAWLRGAGSSVQVVAGGERRQDSVARGFDRVPGTAEIVLVHDAARPFVSVELISRAIDGAVRHGAVIAAVPAHDTIKRVAPGGDAIVETLPREAIYLAQTPQAFRRDVLREAVALGRSGVAGTDEAALAERAGHVVRVIEGESRNVKITTGEDLEAARRTTAPASASSVGIGYDLHRLVDGRALVLGGVTLPSDRGALGHSDADVVCHAVTDAVLGAARAGDIGRLFPDTDPAWKDASSLELLRAAVALVGQRGFTVSNVDVVVILEQPTIAPHRQLIEQRVADALGVNAARVSVKAKTNEGMDAVGRREAIAAHAVALLVVSSEF